MSRFFINGKFCAQRVTGVQRFAGELVRALDAEWPSQPAPVLLVPRGATMPALARIRVEPAGPVGLPLHLWEQVVLPWRAREGYLLNLAGSAPAVSRDRIATLHDAAVFDHPEAYTWAFRWWYRWLFARVARRDAAVLTVSRFSRDRLARVLGVEPDRFDVIPGAGEHLARVAPDDRLRMRLGLEVGRYWLCVSSVNPTKGLDVLLAAWSSSGLADLGARLVLVGGTNPRVFRGGPAQRMPAGVVHAGACSDAELVALLRSAFAQVVPSRYEGFGLPLLEAMALGCPVVATRAAALPEVGGDAAVWVIPDDASALADTMAGLWAAPERLAALREAGQRRSRQFGWTASARLLLRRLDSLPAGDGGRA